MVLATAKASATSDSEKRRPRSPATTSTPRCARRELMGTSRTERGGIPARPAAAARGSTLASSDWTGRWVRITSLERFSPVPETGTKASAGGTGRPHVAAGRSPRPASSTRSTTTELAASARPTVSLAAASSE